MRCRIHAADRFVQHINIRALRPKRPDTAEIFPSCPWTSIFQSAYSRSDPAAYQQTGCTVEVCIHILKHFQSVAGLHPIAEVASSSADEIILLGGSHQADDHRSESPRCNPEAGHVHNLDRVVFPPPFGPKKTDTRPGTKSRFIFFSARLDCRISPISNLKSKA